MCLGQQFTVKHYLAKQSAVIQNGVSVICRHFIQQEYPELIDKQFNKVRQLDMDDLLYKKKDKNKLKKKAKEMRSCLVVTHNPANPHSTSGLPV